MGDLLEVRGLTKHFGGVIANEDIDLTVAEGDVVSIIGPNGAGKSTLFKMICGVRPEGSSRKPDKGTVRYRGHDITTSPAFRVCELGLALVFQETEPLKGMTALENVAIGALVRERSYHAALGKAEIILEEIDLSSLRDTMVSEMTLAERKRLEIGRALATDPGLLMLDETMAGLTSKEVKDAVEMVRGIHARGIAVVLIEHVLEAVMAVSGRVVVLDQGIKIAEGPPEEIVKDPKVIHAYLGGEVVHARDK